MISEKDLRFLRQRRRFQKYGPVMAGALIVIFVLGMRYLVVREVILINSCTLLFALFVIAAIILIYCFYRCVSIEGRHLKIIDPIRWHNLDHDYKPKKVGDDKPSANDVSVG